MLAWSVILVYDFDGIMPLLLKKQCVFTGDYVGWGNRLVRIFVEFAWNLRGYT